MEYSGPRHFDAHAYRTEDEEGVRDFAAGCMRTYLILKEKARRFAEDPEIQEILAELRERGSLVPAADLRNYTPEAARNILDAPLDRHRLARRKLRHERLDQLTVDLLLGVR